jgi:hypothetical protein
MSNRLIDPVDEPQECKKQTINTQKEPQVWIKRSKNVIIHDQKENEQTSMLEEDNDQVPLEMMGIIRAVRKYALQTSAIGMTIGIEELTKIEEIIRSLQPHENGLQTLLSHIEQRQRILQTTFKQAYGM